MTAADLATPSGSQPRKKKKRRGLWWKILLALLIILIIFIILLPTILSTRPGASFLLGQVNGRIPGKLTASHLSVGWFSGASIRDADLTDPTGKNVLHLDSANTGLSLIDLLTPSSLDLGDVTLTGLRANLITYPDGTTNLSRALHAAPIATKATTKSSPAAAPPPASPTAASPPAPAKSYLIHGTLDAQDCQLTWSAPDAPTLTLSKLNAKALLDTSGGANALQLSAQAASGNHLPAAVAVNLTGAFFQNGRLKPLAQLTGTGTASLHGLDLAALSPMLQAAGFHLQCTGTADAELNLANNPTGENLTLTLNVASPAFTGAALQGDTLHPDKLAVALDADLAGGGITLHKCSLDSNLASLKLTGAIQTGPSAAAAPPPPVTLTAAADITALKKQLPKMLGSLPDTQVSAILTGQLDAAKKICTVTAQSTLTEKDAASNQAEGIILAKNSVLSWGDASNDLHATAIYSLARIQKLFAAKFPEGMVVQGGRTAQLHITGPLALDAAGLKKFAHLSIDHTSLGFDQVSYKGLQLGRADVPFQMKNGILTLDPTKVPANGGTLTLSGRLDTTAAAPTFYIDKAAQPTPLLQNVQLNRDIAAGWLSFLPLTWGGSKDAAIGSVSGVLNVSIVGAAIPLDSTLRQSATLEGALRIDNLATDAPFFSDLLKSLGPVAKITQPDILSIRAGKIPETPFSLKNGTVSYNNLTLATNAVSLVFSGSVGMDKSLAMTMTASSRGINVPVPITLAGTVNKPEIKVSGNALQNSLQNGAPKALENLLNRKK